MKNKKYVCYLELKGQGLTQVGYLKLENSLIKKDSCLALPFKLVDKCFAEKFDTQVSAVTAIKKVVDTLNWGYFSSFSRRVVEVEE